MRHSATTRFDLEVGERLRQRRIERGFSQKRLAAAVGVTYQQLARYERGLNRVSISRLQALAAALGASLEDLLGEEERDPVAAIVRDLAIRDEARRLLAAFAAIEEAAAREHLLGLTITLGLRDDLGAWRGLGRSRADKGEA